MLSTRDACHDDGCVLFVLVAVGLRSIYKESTPSRVLKTKRGADIDNGLSPFLPSDNKKRVDIGRDLRRSGSIHAWSKQREIRLDLPGTNEATGGAAIAAPTLASTAADRIAVVSSQKRIPRAHASDRLGI